MLPQHKFLLVIVFIATAVIMYRPDMASNVDVGYFYSYQQLSQPTIKTETSSKLEEFPKLPPELRDAHQSDAELAAHIRDFWIVPPFTGQRNLANDSKVYYSQRTQSQYVDSLLRGKTRGFFVECGAANGETLSNTLFFEKSRNWTGILIEANPHFFEHILKIRRHASMLNACLSPSTRPGLLEFRLAGVLGGLTDLTPVANERRADNVQSGGSAHIHVQCFPLAAVLRAMNRTKVDYFSLDIEGAEYEVLKNFPFDEFDVSVLTIEYAIGDDRKASNQRRDRITQLMVDKFGYRREPYTGPEDIVLSRGI